MNYKATFINSDTDLCTTTIKAPRLETAEHKVIDLIRHLNKNSYGFGLVDLRQGEVRHGNELVHSAISHHSIKPKLLVKGSWVING